MRSPSLLLARGLALLAVLTLAPAALPAQPPVKLSAFLTTFLLDSARVAGGLPWTTGDALPVRWETPRATSAPHLQRAGMTLRRAGTVRVSVDEQPPVEMEVEIVGVPTGIQRVSLSFDMIQPDLDRMQQSLLRDGLRLAPMKCRRETEGTGYGNVVYILRAPGKQAQGLWESWNCAHDGCRGSLAILYRRTDVAEIECAGAS